MPPSHDSDDDDFDLELEDDGLANSEAGDDLENSLGGTAGDDGTEGDDDSNSDDSDSNSDDDDDENDNDEDEDDEERLQQELQESLAMDIDAELRELEESALGVAPEENQSSMQSQTGAFGDDDEQQLEDRAHVSAAYIAPEVPPPLDVPLLSENDEYDVSLDSPSSPPERPSSPQSVSMVSPPPQRRSPSPGTRRHYQLFAPIGASHSTSRLALGGTAPPPDDPQNAPPPRVPRSYGIEAICALPHPTPTHALAASYCMTHVLTGSEDGYIRNYDIFSAVNSKNFLTAPQRQHAGVVEGLMKSGQIRSWWENPSRPESQRRLGLLSGSSLAANNIYGAAGTLFSHTTVEEGETLSPVRSMIMHSDGLWALAGTNAGHINLFTVRHEPGKLIHVMDKHHDSVSALAMDYGEKGFFSAGCDGEAIQWDLNTGKSARTFTAHNSQLTSIAVRPPHAGPYVDPTASVGVAYRRKDREIRDKDRAKDVLTDSSSLIAFKAEDQDGDVSMPSVTTDNPNIHMQVDEPPKDLSHTPHQSPPKQSGQPAKPEGTDDDAKSDASFDPLFDEEGEEGDQPAQQATPAQPSTNPYSNLTFNATPTSNTQPVGAPPTQFITFPIGMSAPQAGPSGQQQGPPIHQSFFHTNPQSTQPTGGQQFQFQLSTNGAVPVPVSVPPTVSVPLQVPARETRPQAAPGAIAAVAAAAPKNAPPLLDYNSYQSYSGDLLMTAYYEGQVVLWDRRVSNAGRGVGRLWMSDKTPPWCLSACWSPDGGQIYAGRRRATVDVWDVRVMGKSGPKNIPRLLKTLRNPYNSGVVSCVAAMPDCRHMVCASTDNIRLWNVADANTEDSSMARSGSRSVLFKVIPGHHGGCVSQILIDPGARFMVTASGNRGWHGDSTRTVFVHDIKQLF
ncbi:WD40 repeat-like protein [Coprinopsis marcescibilis]|uniref:WD40 repeat-like protein n=1 Tax=Coprinopsis marcescibilis TaxID=230819 RepID=A0A5C3LMQ2_COPMA|nr:WD40 repeat-like protein [Coprinopsis marcescibilis]